jgi:hypothetical protein
LVEAENLSKAPRNEGTVVYDDGVKGGVEFLNNLFISRSCNS